MERHISRRLEAAKRQRALIPSLRLRRSQVCASLVIAAVLLAGCPEQEFTLETIFLRPSAEIEATPGDLGFDFDEVSLHISDTRAVSIWHVRAADPKGLVVIIPGSDRNKARYLIALPVFIPNGYDVILMDYEGFGTSSAGPLDFERLSEDGEAVVDYARRQHERVIAFGVSTGAAIATDLAARRELAALLLEAPLILLLEPQLWLKDNGLDVPLLWRIAVTWMAPQVPDSFHILATIPRVEEPKLILHSREDDVVPITAGELVFDLAREPKAFFEMRGGHGEMLEIEPELYTQTVIDWLDATVAPQD